MRAVQEHIEESFQESNIGFKIQVDSELVNGLNKVLNELLVGDAVKVVGSIIFVFLYLNIHLESLFISINGIFIIILSFPVTVLITEYVLQVTYFGSL